MVSRSTFNKCCALDNHTHFDGHYCGVYQKHFLESPTPKSFLSLWKMLFRGQKVSCSTEHSSLVYTICVYMLSNTWQHVPVSMWHFHMAVSFQSLLMMSPDQRRTASQNSYMDEPDEEDLKVKPYTLEEFSYEYFRWSSLCSLRPRKVLVDLQWSLKPSM